VREKEIMPHKEALPHEALEMLKTIGLNLYERKLYVWLLLRGTSTAGELADLSGVPRARVYDVLMSLADKGFVMIQHSKPMKYIAVPPKEALSRAARNIIERAQKTAKLIESFKETEVVSQLEELHKNKMKEEEEGDLVSTIKGKFVIDNHEEYLFKNAKKKIDIMVSDTGLNDIYRRYYPILRDAYERGIKIRIIAPITEENKKAYEVLSDIAEIKDANKMKDQLPYTRLAISDDKETLMHLTHDKQKHPVAQSSIWTGSQHFVKNFASRTFDLIWNMLE